MTSFNVNINQIVNRQDWFETCYSMLAQKARFAPPKTRIGTGTIHRWKSASTRNGFKVHDAKHSADSTFEVFINPRIVDGLDAAEAIARAMITIRLGIKSRPESLNAAYDAAGLGCKNAARSKMQAVLREVVAKLPPLVSMHGALVEKPAQSTRMLKFVCDCGKSIRDTHGSVEKYGPAMHCGNEMELVA